MLLKWGNYRTGSEWLQYGNIFSESQNRHLFGPRVWKVTFPRHEICDLILTDWHLSVLSPQCYFTPFWCDRHSIHITEVKMVGSTFSHTILCKSFIRLSNFISRGEVQLCNDIQASCSYVACCYFLENQYLWFHCEYHYLTGEIRNG